MMSADEILEANAAIDILNEQSKKAMKRN